MSLINKHRFITAQLIFTLSIATAILIGFQVSSVDAKDDKESEVEIMMHAAHKGKKGVRDAPLELLQDEVKKDAPNWKILATNVKPLAKIGAAIKDNRTYTSNPAPYIAAVKALTVAAEKEDVAGARAAVDGLMKSCAGCHRE